jgi:hypothetical protein
MLIWKVRLEMAPWEPMRVTVSAESLLNDVWLCRMVQVSNSHMKLVLI